MAVISGQFILSLLSLSCTHLLLPLCLHNSGHRVVDRAQICIYACDNLSPTTFGCGLPDQIINTCVLTPVLSCGQARCNYNLIKTNTFYFQVWTRPKFTSPSDLDVPLSFSKPRLLPCRFAASNSWAIVRPPRDPLWLLFSVSSDAASGGSGGILCCSNHTGSRDFSSKPL